MRVKLINCLKLFRDTFPPYGLGMINTFLRNNSIKSEIFDLDIAVKHKNSLKQKSTNVHHGYLKNNYDNMYKFLKLKNPNCYLDFQFEKMVKEINLNDVDVVGINSHDDEIYMSLYLAKKIKEKSGCYIAIGGSHVVRMPENRLKYFINDLGIDYVDCFVKSKKPYNFFLELQKSKRYTESKGKPEIFSKTKDTKNTETENKSDVNIPLYNKDHLELYKMDIKKIKHFYPRLNDLLINKFENLQKGKPVLILPYVFTGGCVNKCAFCFASMEKPYKADIESVISDIKAMQKEHQCDNFYFLNNNVTMDKEYALKLFKKFSDELSIRWSDASSIRNLDKKTLSIMADSGCIQLLFGLESASQKLLNYTNKNANYNKVEYYTKCFENCDKNNIWVVVDIIAGLPYETEEDIKRSIDYLEKNKKFINGVFVLPFSLYQNSLMAYNPKKYGLEILNEEQTKEDVLKRLGKNVDVYKEIYYRTLTFNEIDGGLNWIEKQEKIERTRKTFKDYISNSFKTHFYVHYPIFFLYNAFNNDKKNIIRFLTS